MKSSPVQTPQRVQNLVRSLAILGSWLASHIAMGGAFNFNTAYQPGENPVGPWHVWTVSGNASPTVQTSATWGSPQVSLGDAPGIFRSNGTEQFVHDWQLGDMVARTSPSGGSPILITWTPTEAYSQVQFSVQLWPGTSDGVAPWFQVNVSPWGVAEFGDLATLGTFDREHPFRLNGSLGALGVGNDVSLLLEQGRSGAVDGFVGFTFSIEATPIPEPAALTGAVGILLLLSQLKRVLRSRNHGMANPSMLDLNRQGDAQVPK
jgi:hypothetical protein